jgi:hypothetical protein
MALEPNLAPSAPKTTSTKHTIGKPSRTARIIPAQQHFSRVSAIRTPDPPMPGINIRFIGGCIRDGASR